MADVPIETTSKEFVVTKGELRLDLFLAGQELGLTRSQVKRLIEEGFVLLNGAPTKPGQKLQPGDRISVTIPPPKTVQLSPECIPLKVIYQDGEILVLDKPAGLVVHPAPGHSTHTLVNGLLALCPDLKGIGGELRPGIVHRLDKDTSGLMVVAKSAGAHFKLSQQIKARKFHKGYLALVKGRVEPTEGVIEAPIGRDPLHRRRMAVVFSGREAKTRYKVLCGNEDFSFVEAFPETGRTHQIRVHFTSIGHPLVGDTLYGKVSPILNRHFLHAHLLGFHHPVSDEYLEFTSPLPPELQAVLERCLDSLPF